MSENGSPYAWPARFWYPVYFCVAALSAKSRVAQTKIARFGETADWIRSVQRLFPDQSFKVFSDKDRLRRHLIESLSLSNSSVSVVELGVADGAGSRWWLNELGDRLYHLYGFDRFTGLPRSWRGMPVGHFSTNGLPPNIDSPLVSFFVGDAERTVRAAVTDAAFRQALGQGTNIFIFDMDILEPTQEAFTLLQPLMRPGDVVLFDEAFDAANERLVLSSMCDFWEVSLLGVTCEAIALRLAARRQPEVTVT